MVLSHKVQQEEFSALEPCVYLLPEDQVNQLKEIVAFVSYGDLRKLKVGMEVQVTPSDLKREEVGYMYGHITAINELPTSAKEADMLFKINEFTSAVFSSEAAFMVQIRLEDHPQDKSKIRWSHKGGEAVNMKIGTLCSMQIVTTSVTNAGILRGKGQSGVLLLAQSIEIRPQTDTFSTGFSFNHCGNAIAAYVFRWGESHFAQAVSNVRRCMLFLPG